MNPFEFGLTGGLEILVILLLAFLVIGPGRVIRAARWVSNLGKRARNIGSGAQATTKSDRPKKQDRLPAKPKRSVRS
ncbi:MAG: hypothetical protein KJ624_03055 [Chloroflexi bacterium]|nr:hypothetical protein [Chloroflexota bacterium]